MPKTARTEKLNATELAKLIKAGEVGEDSYTELWLLLLGLTHKMSYSFYTRHEARCRQCGVMLEDLKQEAYIAMLNALNAYSADCEHEFTTYYGKYCIWLFYRILGYDRAKSRKDPGLCTTSLSAGIGEEDSTLEDFQADPAAEKAFDEVVENDFKQTCKEALDEAIDKLPTGWAKTIRYKYYDNKTLSEIADICHNSESRQQKIHRAALARLRKNRRLQAIHDDIIYNDSYIGNSFTSWKERGSSVPEKAVIDLERVGALTIDKYGRL